ncbi:hypothetical protein DDE83_003285 [Stemphylium lycopersici]|uniref:ZN622/Rei1/Reh1 zinc finger C2H2-type domain-containing protein n=1 Tax=Stemphylium lycopersici TaxID=183478 RepID=A0A364N7R6_STELY|nr:hypothetical protein DDE83_003285 [Stemphylium lycopersici]
MSSLPAISSSEYEEQESKSATVKRRNGWTSSDEARHWASESQSCSDDNGAIGEATSSGEEDESKELEQHLLTPRGQTPPPPPATTTTHCLFCPLAFPNIRENLFHMSSVHGFTLHPPPPSNAPSTASPSFSNKQLSPPSPSKAQPATTATNLEPLLTYLSLVVFTHRECVYCGKGKRSVRGVQSHMRDKAHCRVEWGNHGDFLGEGEGENGEEDEQDDVEGGSRQVEVQKISGTELRLPSGVVINSRRHRYHHSGSGSSGGMRDGDGDEAGFRLKGSLRQRHQRFMSIFSFRSDYNNNSPLIPLYGPHDAIQPISYSTPPTATISTTNNRNAPQIPQHGTQPIRPLRTPTPQPGYSGQEDAPTARGCEEESDVCGAATAG